MPIVWDIFCTFATESIFPKRETFGEFENEKLSKTEHLSQARKHNKNQNRKEVHNNGN
jgi:hypothetical protein